MRSRRLWFPLTLLALALGVSAPAQRPADPDPDPAALRDRAKQVLAPLEGDVRLPGLKESVEVLRDAWGIPHIYAKNQDDLFFAQGFVTAQDRLFQLELWRRVGTGQTAELFGEPPFTFNRPLLPSTTLTSTVAGWATVPNAGAAVGADNTVRCAVAWLVLKVL